MTAPGWLLYERVRALRRAKHRFLLSRVTVVPRESGKGWVTDERSPV